VVKTINNVTLVAIIFEILSPGLSLPTLMLFLVNKKRLSCGALELIIEFFGAGKSEFCYQQIAKKK
jgi:hypothetical protein